MSPGPIVTIPPAIDLPPGTTSGGTSVLPPYNVTYAIPNFPQTWTGVQSFTFGSMQFMGQTSGSTFLNATAIASGSLVLPAETGTLATQAYVLAHAGGIPGGSNTQLQYNNSAAFGGIPGFTYNGSTLAIPAYTLGGTVSGGGNQLNNIIIGNTTPLAGSFTNLLASGTSIFGTNATLPGGGSTVTAVNGNTGTTIQSMSGFGPQLVVVGPDGNRGAMGLQSYMQATAGNESSYLAFTARGTMASPASTQSGDFVGEFFAHGATTTGGFQFLHNAGAGFVMVATDNFLVGAAGEQINVYTTPTGTGTAALAARFGNDASFSSFGPNLLVGPAAPAAGAVTTVSLTGGASGSNAGTAIAGGDTTHGSIWEVGNTSAILTGAYDPTLMLYSSTSAYRFNGLTTGLLASSSNGTVSVSTYSGDAWSSFSPSITSAVGGFTNANGGTGSGTGTLTSATGTYQQIGKTVQCDIDIKINTVGNAAGLLQATLPVPAKASKNVAALFREIAISGKGGSGAILATDVTKVQGLDSSLVTFIAAGAEVIISFRYEAA